jgi:hypothetical protein
MNKLTRRFNNRVDEIEMGAVAALSAMAIQVASFGGTITSSDNKQIGRIVDKHTSTLSNIRIIRAIPISFN